MYGLVTLTAEEMLEACMVGCRRRIESLLAKRVDDQHAKGDPWGLDIEGAAGERVLAKFMGIPYEGTLNTFKAPDVAGFQVRQTVHKTGHLIIRPKDPDDHVYILIVGEFPIYRPVGYYRGADAKFKGTHSPWWKGDRWEVPQPLLPLSDLGIYEHEG